MVLAPFIAEHSSHILFDGYELENLRKKGTRYEQLAALYLRQHGVRIVRRNFHDGRKGEIDLIGDDHGTLVFVEVKYRSGRSSGYAEEAVTPAKQRTIWNTAKYYLCRYRIPEDRPMRFDVVAISDTDVTGQVYVRWIRNAFSV